MHLLSLAFYWEWWAELFESELFESSLASASFPVHRPYLVWHCPKLALCRFTVLHRSPCGSIDCWSLFLPVSIIGTFTFLANSEIFKLSSLKSKSDSNDGLWIQAHCAAGDNKKEKRKRAQCPPSVGNISLKFIAEYCLNFFFLSLTLIVKSNQLFLNRNISILLKWNLYWQHMWN